MHREIDRLAQIEQRTRRDIIEDHIRAHRERTSKK